MTDPARDQDESKGATEEVDHDKRGNVGLQAQLGHRDQEPLITDADSAFPEPGLNPEHTGEPEVDTETTTANKRIKKTA